MPSHYHTIKIKPTTRTGVWYAKNEGKEYHNCISHISSTIIDDGESITKKGEHIYFINGNKGAWFVHAEDAEILETYKKRKFF
jgi:hypothetical protein